MTDSFAGACDAGRVGALRSPVQHPDAGTASDLHDFLFGSERASLAAVKPILLEVQKGDCFYRHRPLRDESAHVDHFIP